MDNKKAEKLLIPKGGEKADRSRERGEIKEVSEIKKEAAHIVEAVEVQEGKEGAVEFAEGKVAEEISEGKKKAPAGGIGGKPLTDDQIESIRAKLLKNLPPQKVMVSQIRSKLRIEEKKLNKEFRRLKKMGSQTAYELTKVVSKLRKIREYFSMLAHATFEIVKQLWLKIVHGV